MGESSPASHHVLLAHYDGENSKWKTILVLLGSPYVCITSDHAREEGAWRVGGGPDFEVVSEFFEEAFRQGAHSEGESPGTPEYMIDVKWDHWEMRFIKNADGSHRGTDDRGWNLLWQEASSWAPRASRPLDLSDLLNLSFESNCIGY